MAIDFVGKLQMGGAIHHDRLAFVNFGMGIFHFPNNTGLPLLFNELVDMKVAVIQVLIEMFKITN